MRQSKRTRLTEFNRNNILSAARYLFEKHGISQTTMDDIAAMADCSKSTIYVYFKSKDEIYDTLLYESMVMLKESLQNSINVGINFPDKYFSICKALVDFQKQYPMYFDSTLGKIRIDESDFEQSPVLRNIYNIGEEINDLLLSVINTGIGNGEILKNIDPIPTIFMLWSSIGGIIKASINKESYLRNKNIKSSEFLDYSFKLLLKTITGGK